MRGGGADVYLLTGGLAKSKLGRNFNYPQEIDDESRIRFRAQEWDWSLQIFQNYSQICDKF